MMLNADEVVDAYYLEVRCMLLEIAATLDRLDRASTEGSPTDGSPTDGGPTGGGPDANRSTQVDRLYRALEMLSDRQTSADRSERLLHLFSE